MSGWKSKKLQQLLYESVKFLKPQKNNYADKKSLDWYVFLSKPKVKCMNDSGA